MQIAFFQFTCFFLLYPNIFVKYVQNCSVGHAFHMPDCSKDPPDYFRICPGSSTAAVSDGNCGCISALLFNYYSLYLAVSAVNLCSLNIPECPDPHGILLSTLQLFRYEACLTCRKRFGYSLLKLTV